MSIKRLLLYFFKKLTKLMSLLIIICIMSFILVSYSPIDPIQTYVGADITRVGIEQREQIAEYWGLNEGKSDQFLNWGQSILQGNFGTSFIYRTPVVNVITDRFLASLILVGFAWLFSGIFGFILGIIASMYERTLIDKLIKLYCFTLASTPAFWLGLLFLMLFSVKLGWFPVGLASPAGMLTEDIVLTDRIKHLILPVLTLSVIGVANVALHTRQKLLDIYNSEFIRYAKAKGEKGFSLLWRHGLRHISLPAISLHFASFGEIFGGAVLAEQVFSYPGLGQAVVQAGLGQDVPLLLGIVLFSTLFVFFGNMMADILYRLIDPRLRKEEFE